MTTEFVRTIHADVPAFSLIEQQSLLSRLIQELGVTVRELIHDPRGFIRDLLSADTKDAKRRQRIYLGLACAMVIHIALLITIAVVGWRTVFERGVEAKAPDYVIIPLPTTAHKIDPASGEVPKGNPGGGGGGGQHTVLPPSKGEPPVMLPLPPIVRMNPSTIPEPSLAVSPSIVGPPSPPPPPAPTGDPTGKSGDFSGGPGAGDGIGRGKGPGVGGGNDGGAGPGSRGGRAGGPAGLPNSPESTVPTVIDFAKIRSLAGYRPWTWIHKERAIITPEARENKIIGTVVLRANFNADGTITDIEVAMPVDFMNEAAVESLRRCTFHPATINGIPVSVRRALIRIDVHY